MKRRSISVVSTNRPLPGPPGFPKWEGIQLISGRESWCQDLDNSLRVGAVMFPHVYEAISCAAEVTDVVEAEAVEHAAAVPAVVRRLDAAIVRLPVAHSALQRHVLRGCRLAFNRSPEGSVKLFGRAFSRVRSAPTTEFPGRQNACQLADFELEILGCLLKRPQIGANVNSGCSSERGRRTR